jgi:uncharacterized protein YjiS (DUF1127 family)
MISLGGGTRRFGRLLGWSKLALLFAVWQQRLQSRYQVERLSERELADMRLTRLDSVSETQKPFWEP